VMTALPGQAKRALARSVRDMDLGRGFSGAVRGDRAGEKSIIGMCRCIRSA
jgi:hypothetical protein